MNEEDEPVKITHQMQQQDSRIRLDGVGSWGVLHNGDWYYHTHREDAERLIKMFNGVNFSKKYI